PAMAELESPEPGKEAEEMMEALRQWKADCQVAATITEGGELLEYDREQGALLSHGAQPNIALLLAANFSNSVFRSAVRDRAVCRSKFLPSRIEDCRSTKRWSF